MAIIKTPAEGFSDEWYKTVTTGTTSYTDPRGVYAPGTLVASGTTTIAAPGSLFIAASGTTMETVTPTAAALLNAMYHELEQLEREGASVEDQGRLYASYFIRIREAIVLEQGLAAIQKDAKASELKAKMEIEAAKAKAQLEDAAKLASPPSGFTTKAPPTAILEKESMEAFKRAYDKYREEETRTNTLSGIEQLKRLAGVKYK